MVVAATEEGTAMVDRKRLIRRTTVDFQRGDIVGQADRSP